MATNLLVLAFFKYAALLTELVVPTKYNDEKFFIILTRIPLPIGISFFTFEGISLLVDIYTKREQAKGWAETSFYQFYLKTVFFISFFPHLIAGPILKANSFIPQIGVKLFKDIKWETAAKNLILGFFFKCVVADNLKDFTLTIVVPFESHPVELLAGLFGYSFQIFADFFGYSLIALGLSKLLGYDLIQNFNFPYISRSFSEFWTRWHISLSTWLKEYLYFPLGGNRKGNIRTLFNLFIVMLLGGLWHGASWNFAIWGGVHGLALAAERIFKKHIKIPVNGATKFIQMALVFSVVSFAWLFFKFTDIKDVGLFLKALSITKWTNFKWGLTELYILVYSSPVVLLHLYYYLKTNSPSLKIFNTSVSQFLYAIMLFLIITNSGINTTFIYFRF